MVDISHDILHWPMEVFNTFFFLLIQIKLSYTRQNYILVLIHECVLNFTTQFSKKKNQKSNKLENGLKLVIIKFIYVKKKKGQI